MVPEQFSHNLSLSYTMKNGRYNVSFECRNFTDAQLFDNFSLQKSGGAHSMESSECFSVNNKSKFLVSINNKRIYEEVFYYRLLP